MSTDLKTRKRFTSTISNILKLNLENLSSEARIPQSRLLDEAIEDLLLKYKKQGFKVVTKLSDEGDKNE